MKRLLLLFVVAAAGAFAFPTPREKILTFARTQIPALAKFIPTADRPSPEGEGMPTVTFDLPMPVGPSDNSRSWTFADGTRMDAVLVSADTKNAQFRVVESQGVGEITLDHLSEQDRGRILSWVGSEGKNGVAGFPIRLKTHRWPEQWRSMAKVPMTRMGETNKWWSEHFDITNEAEVGPEALEAITLICESVDGALNALPLPLPINWGRQANERRKIVIERSSAFAELETSAGYWDGLTGIVHINADALLEPDLQLVVFEFDKPEKVQKYDVIVHEVTHQSMGALMYLGVPAWLPEGIAEYMSATQFAPAFYQFTNSHVSIRYHINKRVLGDRIVKDRKMNVSHLEKLMTRDIVEWNRILDSGDVAGFLQYNEALLLIDYFVHRDHPDGVHFRRYLECILSGVPESEARAIHLLRGRSYTDLEREIFDLWKPLGFTLNYQDRSELLAGDVEIDWDAEDVKRTIATERAMGGSLRRE